MLQARTAGPCRTLPDFAGIVADCGSTLTGLWSCLESFGKAAAGLMLSGASGTTTLDSTFGSSDVAAIFLLVMTSVPFLSTEHRCPCAF
jgi:hypothetical protein